MKTSPDIKQAWAVRGRDGAVVVYADEGRTKEVRSWRYYASDKPTPAQRYIHHSGTCYSLRWREF